MCGLVGVYSSNMMPKHKDVLSAMLYLDTWRGRDSTGVAAIRANSDTLVLKSTVPGYEFVEGNRLDNHLKFNDFCWIGHNRYGTIGKNIKTNAHPFIIENAAGQCTLVGAHNGTLKNKHDLLEHAKFGTDSEALLNNIAVEGLEESIKKVEGAWALTYYDHTKTELRIIRNKERPLFYAFEEGSKTLFWASEMWMIRVACSRADIKLEKDKVFSFNEDTLYRFPAPIKMNDEITMERKGGVVGKPANAFFQNWNSERWVGGEKRTYPQTEKTTTQAAQTVANTNTQSGTNDQNSGEKLQTKKSGSSSSTPNEKVRNILSAKKFKGFDGVLLSQKEMESQLEDGCGWCELEFITEKDRFAWLAPSKPVCHKCLIGEEEPEKLKINSSFH